MDSTSPKYLYSQNTCTLISIANECSIQPYNTQNTAVLVPNPTAEPKARFAPWLDVVAIALWGALLLTYWRTERLGLLIHPAYNGLVVAAGLVLLVLAAWLAIDLARFGPDNSAQGQHRPLLPPRFATWILLLAAIVGFIVSPQPLASQKALQRGIAENAVTMTRSNPQTFRPNSRPEQRQLIDWVRTLNVYPEPEAYSGQAVNVDGFVVRPEGFPTGYYLIARFAITCCAADAYPLGLPVKPAPGDTEHPADQWLSVRGKMTVETIAGERRLVIAAEQVQPIATPANPYAY